MIWTWVRATCQPGLVERFQREIVMQCGRSFVRMMRGDVQTDSEVAQKLLAAKHFPPMPAASVDTRHRFCAEADKLVGVLSSAGQLDQADVR